MIDAFQRSISSEGSVHVRLLCFAYSNYLYSVQPDSDIDCHPRILIYLNGIFQVEHATEK